MEHEMPATTTNTNGTGNRSVRRFIKDCYKRLDRVGGPSARVLNEMGGEAEFRRERKRLGV